MKIGDCVQDPEGQIWMKTSLGYQDWMCVKGEKRGKITSGMKLTDVETWLAASKEVWVEVTVLPSPRQKFLTRSFPGLGLPRQRYANEEVYGNRWPSRLADLSGSIRRRMEEQQLARNQFGYGLLGGEI